MSANQVGEKRASAVQDMRIGETRLLIVELLKYVPKSDYAPFLVLFLTMFLLAMAILVSPVADLSKIISILGLIAIAAAASVILVWLASKGSTPVEITKEDIRLVVLLRALEQGLIAESHDRYISKPLRVSQRRLINFFDKVNI